MEINKLSNYNRLDILRRRLILKKIQFCINTFLLLPLITWVFFVWLGPIVDANKEHQTLSSWLQFWGVVFTTAEIIFCAFVFIAIHNLREKIEIIENSMDRR